MKYKTFPTEQAAANALRKIYADMARDHANQRGGDIEDVKDKVKRKASALSDNALADGERYPIKGKRASDSVWNETDGFTTAYAWPVKIKDGRWVFPSPDDTGEEPGDDWWPPSAELA